MTLKYTLLNGNTFRPYRATPRSVGFDLYLPRDCVSRANSTQTIDLDIVVAIPELHYGDLCDKSSVAQRGLHVLAGVVDSDYRGPVKVVLRNLTDADVSLHRGQPLCQLLVKPYCPADIEEVESLDPTTTERGEGGFGSTHDENNEPRSLWQQHRCS